MRVRSPLSLLIAGALFLASGSIGIARADERTPSTVQVYELNPYTGKPYDVVGRLWTGSWRSAFGIPTYSNRDEAIAAMRNEAASLNADALINVSCLDQRGSTWRASNEPAFLCYAVAVQLRRS